MLKKFAAVALIACLMGAASVQAAEPYENYTYSSTGEIWVEPQAYYADRILLGKELGIGDFRSPGDVFVARDGRIYIADTGNHRVVILKADYTVDRVIKTFENGGKTDTFSSPSGVFVTADNALYVADTENRRLLNFDSRLSLVRVIGVPEFNVDEKFDYKPVRVAVDSAGRLFVVSKNVNYGMIELDRSGAFSSFYGAIKVSASLTDSLWRRLATETQRERMLQNVPTEYSSNAIDVDGFLFGTISTAKAEYHVCKLNAQGNDVLRRRGAVKPEGDAPATDSDGKEVASTLVDVCVSDNNVYSLLDSARGRVFTYDNNGNLLYVFGALGDRRGCFTQPSAVDVTADKTYLVADSGSNKIVCFAPTEYAKKINLAVKYQYERNYEAAEKLWVEMLKYSANSESAYREIGKAYYRQGDYRTAMKYYRLAKDQDQYSKAFKQYRRQVMDAHFNTAMTVLVSAGAVLAVTVGLLRYRKHRKGGGGS